MDSGRESGVDVTDFNIATELREAIKLRGLKFIHQNIGSIRGKLDELNIVVSQCPNLHILVFTETWLNNSIADGEISLSGYKILRATVCKYRPKSSFCGTSSKFEFRSFLAHR